MYPIQCYAGFPMPLKKGKFEICGFFVTVETPSAASQFAIVDDRNIGDNSLFGNPLSTIDNQKAILVNVKGLANADGVLAFDFAEPIKTRNGISIFATNILGGSMCVYIK